MPGDMELGAGAAVKGRPLSEATAAAVELVRSGEVSTFLEAARRMGVAPSTVADACERRGIESATGAKRRAASRLRHRAVALVRGGMSIREAAAQLGISRPTVSGACTRAGVEGRRGGHPPMIDRAALRAAWHLVLRRELTVKDLAERWGVTVQAVRQAAKALGLPPAGRRYGPW